MAFPSMRGGASARTSIAQLGRWLSAWFLGSPATVTPTRNGDDAPKTSAIEPAAISAPISSSEPLVPVTTSVQVTAPDEPLATAPAVRVTRPVEAPAVVKTRLRGSASKATAMTRKRPAKTVVAQRAKGQMAGPKAKANKAGATVQKKASPKARTTSATKGSARTLKGRRAR